MEGQSLPSANVPAAAFTYLPAGHNDRWTDPYQLTGGEALPNLMLVPEVSIDEQLVAVRDLLVPALRNRGLPQEDAEDACQQAMVKILARPSYFAPHLANLESNPGYFVRMAFNEYLQQLRAERRRRRREESQARSASRLTGGTDGPDVGDALVLVRAAPLSKLQREYILAVLVEHLSVEQLAVRTGTSPRAVRAVLYRAVAIVREQRLRAA